MSLFLPPLPSYPPHTHKGAAAGEMAANDADLSFRGMSGAELRQWVEANPGRVNDREEPT